MIIIWEWVIACCIMFWGMTIHLPTNWAWTEGYQSFHAPPYNYKGYIMYTYSNTYDGTNYQNYDIGFVWKWSILQYTLQMSIFMRRMRFQSIGIWGYPIFGQHHFFLCQNHSPFCGQKNVYPMPFIIFDLEKIMVSSQDQPCSYVAPFSFMFCLYLCGCNPRTDKNTYCMVRLGQNHRPHKMVSNLITSHGCGFFSFPFRTNGDIW